MMIITGRSILRMRRWIEYNTDPQRRCYDGCHFSSEWRWTAWATLERFDAGTDQAKIDARLVFWRELNEYAVKERGESAKCDFRVVPEAEDPTEE